MIDSALIKKANRTPIISDVADIVTQGGEHPTQTGPDDTAKLRLGGGVLGAAGGGVAGLLGHYVAADKKKRKLKDYLKSMLIGGGIGGLGLGAAGGMLGEEMKSRSVPGGSPMF